MDPSARLSVAALCAVFPAGAQCASQALLWPVQHSGTLCTVPAAAARQRVAARADRHCSPAIYGVGTAQPVLEARRRHRLWPVQTAIAHLVAVRWLLPAGALSQRNHPAPAVLRRDGGTGHLCLQPVQVRPDLPTGNALDRCRRIRQSTAQLPRFRLFLYLLAEPEHDLQATPGTLAERTGDGDHVCRSAGHRLQDPTGCTDAGGAMAVFHLLESTLGLHAWHHVLRRYGDFRVVCGQNLRKRQFLPHRALAIDPEPDR
ncbi:hypothetical protein D3C78_1015140 [compost metagenome]